MPARAPRRSIWCRCSPSICSASTCNTSSASAVAGDGRLAFERGETNIDYQTSSAYLRNVTPMVEAGDAVPLFTWGILDEDGNPARDPTFPDLPIMESRYRCCTVKPRRARYYEAYQASTRLVCPRMNDGPSLARKPRTRRPRSSRPGAPPRDVFEELVNTKAPCRRGTALEAYGQVTDGACGKRCSGVARRSAPKCVRRVVNMLESE